jgi:Cu+-exporting ATPase
VVVLDKTGTVTEGKPRVTDIVCAPGVTEERLLNLAASLESASEHPLAEAVTTEARKRGLEPERAEEFDSVPGQGVAGRVRGESVRAGNLRFIKSGGIDPGSLESEGVRLSGEGKTPLYFAAGETMLGVVAAADVVRESSLEAVREFANMGLETVLLTGDNKRTAEAIGRQLGISRVVAEVLPQDKEREVKKLQEQGKKVAMVGDGINDAPALTRADVGIAIGAGTDVAIESADIVLMKSDLRDAATAFKLSRAVLINIKENLFWALVYNSLGIPLAAGLFYGLLGWKLNPMFAAAAMSLSSVSVVSNALRLKLFKSRPARRNNADNKGKEDLNMKKTITIEGMSCSHCVARVEKALGGIDGVTARVSLEKKSAEISLTKPVADETLKRAVEDAGYTVLKIE